MGAGISICHCNSSHATSPGKATLRSLSQPDRVNATAAGHDSFFTVGRSLTAPSASPKSLGPRRNGSYKPQKAASDDSIESHMKEHNNNAIPSPKSKALVKEEQTKCSTSPELTSSDSALVIDLTEDNTESRAESSSAENRGTLPSQAHRPKSAAPSRSLRRSCRRQRSMKKEQIQEVGNSEKSCENLDDLPPFRRFRPKSARDPRRRSNRVTDFRGQSSQLSRSLSMPSRKTLKLQLKRSDGESSDLSDDISLSSDTDDDQVDISSSDTLSIPDETDPSCGNTVTTITVKPKFGHSGLGYRKNPKLSQNPQTDASEVKGGIWERSSLTKSASTTITASKDDNNNRAKSAVGRLNALVGANNADENDNEDYNDDNNNSSYNNNFFSTSYHGSGFADDRVGGSGFSKKASERSISGVILLTPCELPDFLPAHITSTSSTSKPATTRISSSPLPSPNSTPRTPATIKLSHATMSSSALPLSLPSSDDTSISIKYPLDSPYPSQHSPPPPPYSPPRSPLPSTLLVTSIETNSVCSVCLQVILPATINGSDLESSVEASISLCVMCLEHASSLQQSLYDNRGDLEAKPRHRDGNSYTMTLGISYTVDS
ncbi:hypothetical protein RRG08_045999 [Elysia crispata]|uniref:Uncharacterized protein n=1 Tax=Elysia crispata TaxID=231223 RepID=A0AAE0Z049_9GAST|nr:hypothetical protein RRG08_045999 [Elysia crispata]